MPRAIPVFVANPSESPATLSAATNEEANAHLHQRRVLQLRQEAHERRAARELARRPGGARVRTQGVAPAMERRRATKSHQGGNEFVRPTNHGERWAEPAAVLPPSALHDLFCTSRKLGGRRRAVLFCAQCVPNHNALPAPCASAARLTPRPPPRRPRRYLAASGCPKAAQLALDEGGVPRAAAPLLNDTSKGTKSDYLSFYSVLESFQDELEVNAYQRSRPAASAPPMRPMSAHAAVPLARAPDSPIAPRAWIHKHAEAPAGSLVPPHGHPDAVAAANGEPLERVPGTPFLAKSPRAVEADAAARAAPEYAKHEYFQGDCGEKAQMVAERMRRMTEEGLELDEKLKQFQYYNAYVAQRVGGGFDVGFQLVDRRELDEIAADPEREVGPPPTAHLKTHRSSTFSSAMRESQTLRDKAAERAAAERNLRQAKKLVGSGSPGEAPTGGQVVKRAPGVTVRAFR